MKRLNRQMMPRVTAAILLAANIAALTIVTSIVLRYEMHHWNVAQWESYIKGQSRLHTMLMMYNNQLVRTLESREGDQRKARANLVLVEMLMKGSNLPFRPGPPLNGKTNPND